MHVMGDGFTWVQFPNMIALSLVKFNNESSINRPNSKQSYAHKQALASIWLLFGAWQAATLPTLSMDVVPHIYLSNINSNVIILSCVHIFLDVNNLGLGFES